MDFENFLTRNKLLEGIFNIIHISMYCRKAFVP